MSHGSRVVQKALEVRRRWRWPKKGLESEEIKGLDVGEHDMHAYSLKEDGVFQLTVE
ncbi:MAG: hypothetical protein AAFN65_01050 [Bacteroidota bacterium]